MISEHTDNSSLMYSRVFHWALCIGLISDWVCAAAIPLRRLYRLFPMFSVYIAYTALGDTVGLALYLWSSGHVSWIVFLSFSWTGYLLEFGVLFEIVGYLLTVSGTLNRIKATQPTLIGLTAFIFAISCLGGGAIVYHRATPSLGSFLRFELADGVCRSLMFIGVLCLAWIPEVRHLRWPLRLAYYLSFYFGVALACQIAHEIQATRESQFDYFERIETVRIAAWILTMGIVTVHILRFRRSRPDVSGFDIKVGSGG